MKTSIFFFTFWSHRLFRRHMAITRWSKDSSWFRVNMRRPYTMASLGMTFSWCTGEPCCFCGTMRPWMSWKSCGNFVLNSWTIALNFIVFRKVKSLFISTDVFDFLPFNESTDNSMSVAILFRMADFIKGRSIRTEASASALPSDTALQRVAISDAVKVRSSSSAWDARAFAISEGIGCRNFLFRFFLSFDGCVSASHSDGGGLQQ